MASEEGRVRARRETRGWSEIDSIRELERRLVQIPAERSGKGRKRAGRRRERGLVQISTV